MGFVRLVDEGDALKALAMLNWGGETERRRARWAGDHFLKRRVSDGLDGRANK